MVRASYSLAAVAASTACPMNPNTMFPTSVQVSGTFVGTYSIEGTLDNVMDPTVTPTWSAVANGAALTAGALVAILTPLTAVRLNVTAYTSGTVTMKVLQGDSSN